MRKKSRPGVLPAVGNELFWEERVRPLIVFLKEERNWFELAVWARSNKIGGYLLRNYLAYLENRGKAEAIAVRVRDTREVIWIWRIVDTSRPETALFAGYERVDPKQVYGKEDEPTAVVLDDDAEIEDEIEEDE